MGLFTNLKPIPSRSLLSRLQKAQFYSGSAHNPASLQPPEKSHLSWDPSPTRPLSSDTKAPIFSHLVPHSPSILPCSHVHHKLSFLSCFKVQVLILTSSQAKWLSARLCVTAQTPPSRSISLKQLRLSQTKSQLKLSIPLPCSLPLLQTMTLPDKRPTSQTALINSLPFWLAQPKGGIPMR